MKERQKTRQKRTCVPKLAASKRFGMYKDEEKKENRIHDVRRNRRLDKILIEWENYLCAGRFEGFHEIDRVKAIARKLHYTSEDVEKFCAVLAEYVDVILFSARAGMFLTALIASGKESKYIVNTGHLPLIEYFGVGNSKHITVNGDLGNEIATWMEGGIVAIHGSTGFIGKGMKGGTIILDGNCDRLIGERMAGGRIRILGGAGNHVGTRMKGGLIEINGDAGACLGAGMEGGKIIVKGNAGFHVGSYSPKAIAEYLHQVIKGEMPLNSLDRVGRIHMAGGEIHIGGEIGSIGNIEHGKIYHKGKLIVDK